MRAYIKGTVELSSLKDHGFKLSKNVINSIKVYKRKLKASTYIVVNTRTREVQLVNPFGGGNIQKAKDEGAFDDLIESELIVFV